MRDRAIFEIFDATLPRLDIYKPGSVPASGNKEFIEHQTRVKDCRVNLVLLGSLTGLMGLLTWFASLPLMPIWLLALCGLTTGLSGAMTVANFLQLAFGRRLEQALPSGTDAVTAQLEDGARSLIRYWNYDAFVWNEQVEELRLEVARWHVLKSFPEKRDVEWTEEGSMIRAEGLIAAIEGLVSDRAALLARREEIEHRLRALDARLHQLEWAEEPAMPALPPPTDEDPTNEG